MNIETKLKPIWFISLGPGDEELLTISARKKIDDADLIFFPETINTQASNKKAGSLMERLGVPNEKLKPYQLPMTTDCVAAQDVYHKVSMELEHAYQNGLYAAVVAEGDISLYSSAQSIASIVKAKGIPIKFEAGIPSFIEAASRFGISLTRYTESLLVSSKPLKEEELESIIIYSDCIVLMKISRNKEVIKKFIAEHPQLKCYYAERIGMSDEFITENHNQIQERDFPYFSLLIIKK